MSDVLYANRDVFVTESSPALGKTSLVEHTIHLKDNFVPKLQRPFRLAPDKKQILRHQLDELLKQGTSFPQFMVVYRAHKHNYKRFNPRVSEEVIEAQFEELEHLKTHGFVSTEEYSLWKELYQVKKMVLSMREASR